MTTVDDLRRCYTTALTMTRKDGRTVDNHRADVFDGDTAYVRTTGGTGKVKRIRRDGEVLAAPATTKGNPAGDAMPMRAHMANEAETKAAVGLLRKKYPLIHGVVFRLAERFQRTINVVIVLEPTPAVPIAAS